MLVHSAGVAASGVPRQTAHQDTALLTQILQLALPLRASPSAFAVTLWDHSSSCIQARKYTAAADWKVTACAWPGVEWTHNPLLVFWHRQWQRGSHDPLFSYQHFAKDKQSSWCRELDFSHKEEHGRQQGQQKENTTESCQQNLTLVSTITDIL